LRKKSDSSAEEKPGRPVKEMENTKEKESPGERKSAGGRIKEEDRCSGRNRLQIVKNPPELKGGVTVERGTKAKTIFTEKSRKESTAYPFGD